MAEPFNLADVEKYKTLFAPKPRPGFPTAPALEAERSGISSFLGKTDYAAQNKEATDLARLQMAMSLMGRGFAAMGAAPQPGESPIGALGRTLVAPVAGDITTITGPLMKQRAAAKLAEQAEERQIKLSALQSVQSRQALEHAAEVAATNQARQLALMSAKKTATVSVKLTVGGKRQPVTIETDNLGNVTYKDVNGEVIPGNKLGVYTEPTVTAPKIGLDPYVVVRRGPKDGLSLVKEEGGNAAVQVRQGNVGAVPTITNIKTQLPYTLLPSQEIMKLSEYTKGAGTGGKAANAGFMQNTTTKEYQHVTRRGPGEPAFFSLSGDPVSDTKAWVWVGSTLPSAATSETDAQRQAQSRRGLLLDSLAGIQVKKEFGDTSAWNSKAAFYFDAGAHLKEEFAFRYVPPGTDINDRSRDVTITNPRIKKLINNKLSHVSDTILKANFGDSGAEVQRGRLQDAARMMLSLPASTVFGQAAIESIGTNSANETIGYTPTTAASSTAAVLENAKTAMATLGNADNRYTPLPEVLGPLPDPESEKASRTTWGRLKVASNLFPGPFTYTGEGAPGTDDYDEGLVQQRLDVEAGLRSAVLNPQASATDHRAVLQKVATANAEKRETSQSELSESGNELLATRLAFRDALLAFKNAAAETNVAGFISGTLAGTAARLVPSFAEFIAGPGAEHWARLQAASERMSSGHSRRVGREFGDIRISNYDATDYKKLLPSIKNGEAFNSILINDALKRTKVELTQLMENGGNVGWTRGQLQKAAEAGVDFSALRTKMDWHGHGYYGKNRYSASRQYAPTLTDEQRNSSRTRGQLKDTMYGGQYSVPGVNWTSNEYAFSAGQPAQGGNPAVEATPVTRMDPPQFETWLKGRADAAGISLEDMRRRVVNGIISYNAWRENLR